VEEGEQTSIKHAPHGFAKESAKVCEDRREVANPKALRTQVYLASLH